MMVGGCGVSITPNYDEIKINIDKGGGYIIPGDSDSYNPISVPFKIIGWAVAGDNNGSISVDVRRAYQTIPTGGDSIVGASGPSLSTSSYNSSYDVSDWDTEIIAGDIIGVSVDSVVGLKYVVITLKIVRC